MLNITCYDEKVKEVLQKYLKSTGLETDSKYYWSVENVEKDVKYFQEYMNRTPKVSGFTFEPRVSMQGMIYNGFLLKINKLMNYYDYKWLKHYLYIFEILKRLFENHWISNGAESGIDKEKVKQISEFHCVVKYYFEGEIKSINDYISDFIGSSYSAEEFNKCLAELCSTEIESLNHSGGEEKN